MKTNCLHIGILFISSLISFPAVGQEKVDPQSVVRTIEKSDALLERFTRKCEKRTQKAERRFERYERKMTSERATSDRVTNDGTGAGKEPLLDSLRLVYGFAGDAGLLPEPALTNRANENLTRAQQQLNVTQRTKSELLQRKEYWKAQVKEHPEYGKWLGKMEKERYYYTAQVNEYRKVLRDPSAWDDRLMAAVRRDPRWSDFVATLPAKPQNTDKMQPRQLVQQMMQSQAAAIDPDAAKVIRDAQQKGNELLGNLSNQAASFGNLDNATQVPKFTPNPYKTKSFWERIDVGFNLQFDGRTQFLPSSGVAGAQASFNFDQKFSVGVLANYRFGMGEIRNIHFSHSGAGYGAFANYKIWKGLGVQAGYERNRRAEMEMGENRYPAAWTSSALAGLTWEYGIGKKAKGTVGVFFDVLYQKHTPETNAVLWRMGWKL